MLDIRKWPWKAILIALFVIDLLCLNLVAAELLFFRNNKGATINPIFPVLNEQQTNTPTQGVCPTVCVDEFNRLLSKSLATISASPKVTEEIIQPTAKPTVPTQQRAKTAYVPLLSSGSSAKMEWESYVPSDFYFDLSDYPDAKSVQFIAYLKPTDGSGKAFARLYDTSNKRAVDYSDLQSTSGTYELVVSSPLVIWRGNNLYRIQLKSLNGSVAAIQDAKLRINY